MRAAFEKREDCVLSSANISETHCADSMRPSLACSVAPPRCIALAPTLCNITDVNFQSLVGLLWSVLCSTDELHRELAEPHGASALARLSKHCRFHEGSATKASPDARADCDVKLPSFNQAPLIAEGNLMLIGGGRTIRPFVGGWLSGASRTGSSGMNVTCHCSSPGATTERQQSVLQVNIFRRGSFRGLALKLMSRMPPASQDQLPCSSLPL